MKKNNLEKYYKTSDLNLGSYLFSKGVELGDVDKITNPKRAIFVFINNPDIEKYVQDFKFDKELQKFIYAQRMLKNQLYNNY